MAASDGLFALRKFRQDKKMLNGMLIDLRRHKSIQTRIIAAEFFAHILQLEKGEVYDRHIAEMLVSGRLVRKLVRCLQFDENDIYLKRFSAEALSTLFLCGDQTDKHLVGDMGGRAALIEMIHPFNDPQLRTTAIIGTLHNIRNCEQCRQALREGDLLDRLAAILLYELNLESVDVDYERQRRLQLVLDLIEALIDGSPESALRVFGFATLRKDIIARINRDDDEMCVMLRGFLVKSVKWCHERRFLKEEGLEEALEKLKSVGTNEMSAEVERALALVRDA
uniref:Uncharacterized protein n=1 Tax=Plectus sambesii TaxID=2011161 RepID=A0A914VU27_9BILA